MKVFSSSFLALILLFAALPLEAGSVASKSLIKSRQANIHVPSRNGYNPAVLGFNPEGSISTSIESKNLEYGTSGDLEITHIDLTYKQESFFYNIRQYNLLFASVNVEHEGSTLSAGWADKDFSVATYSASAKDQDGRNDTFFGFGMVMAIGENAFFGFSNDTGPMVPAHSPPTRQFNRSFGIAYRVEQELKVEYSVTVDVNNYADLNKILEFDLEYQWSSFVFAVTATNQITPTSTSNFTHLIVAYVPEDSAFDISFGILEISDANILGGTSFSVGYVF